MFSGPVLTSKKWLESWKVGKSQEVGVECWFEFWLFEILSIDC